jgi:hypothetical protein
LESRLAALHALLDLEWTSLQANLGSHVPYFFLACLLSSTVGLIRTITEKHRTLADFEKAALYSLFWAGFFGAYDLFLRLKVRKKSQSAIG